jgi:hypothetical protein
MSRKVFGKLVVFLSVALTAIFFSPMAQAKDSPEESAKIYQHTYDEVFLASQEAIERMGLFLTDKDKDKGIISGNGDYEGMAGNGPRRIPMVFNVRVETISARPEVQVSISATGKGIWWRQFAREFCGKYLREVQKTLATYH